MSQRRKGKTKVRQREKLLEMKDRNTNEEERAEKKKTVGRKRRRSRGDMLECKTHSILFLSLPVLAVLTTIMMMSRMV